MSKQQLTTLPTDFSINSEDGGGLRLTKSTKIICDVDSFFMIKNENEDTSVLTQNERLYSTDPLPKETTPAIRLGNENQDSLDITPEKDINNVVLPDRTQLQPIESKQPSLLPLPDIEPPLPFTPPSPIAVTYATQSFEEANFLPEDENMTGVYLYDENIDIGINTTPTSDNDIDSDLSKNSENLTSVPNPNSIVISKTGTIPSSFTPSSPYYSFINAAKASLGTRTDGLGTATDFGNKGCGAGASIIYLRATGHGLKYTQPPQPGKNINLTYSVNGVVQLLEQDNKNWIKLNNWRDAQPGDFIATKSGTQSGHCGWVIDEKKSDDSYTIVSNSSSKKYIDNYYSIKKWSATIAQRPGTNGTVAYRFKGSFFPPNKSL
jgi:hypothetical protein